MNRNKRILMIAPLPPPVHGSAMITKYIKDSAILNQNFNFSWINLSTSRKMDEIGNGSFKKLWRFIFSFLQAGWKLAFNKYDICYLAITCHGIGFLKDFPFIMLCKLFRKKIVIHQHNKGMSQDVNKTLYRYLFKLAYRNAKVILLSWNLYPDIEKIVKREQVSICPNGIPQETILNSSPNIKPRLLFLSNLIKSKGVMTLLDACQILNNDGYDFECIFVGSETAEIDSSKFNIAIKDRGLTSVVKYLGRKYGQEKNKELSDCDIFVFPTNYPNECFPLVVLEAMQHKCAVVTTNIGGIPDIIEDGESGMIVPPDNPLKLAETLKILISNQKLRNDLANNAFEKFNRIYTLDYFENNICQLLAK